MTKSITPFSFIYDSFLSKITDDMYMELTETDTHNMLEELLISAIHKFEFPRHELTFKRSYFSGNNYESCCPEEDENEEDNCDMCFESHFTCKLTPEEINIIATYMIVEWLGQQLATVENVRMKYSGSDFKFTSQANHMHKILQLKKDYEREGFHLQRLYKRRNVNKAGRVVSTFGTIMSPIEEDE